MAISETYNVDCMDYMASIPDKWFDLAIVDPPYGIGISKFKTMGSKKRRILTTYESKQWDNCIPKEHYFKELFRVSKEQIIWGANYFTQFIPPSSNWIVWDKLQPEGISFAMHELAYCSIKSQSVIYRRSREGNRCTNIQDAQKYIKIHPTQKPIDLYVFLLNKFAKNGDRIFDSHLGSGSSRIASYKMGFDFYATEIDREYFDAQEKRFREACFYETELGNGKKVKQKSIF